MSVDQVLPDGGLFHDVCARPPAPGVPRGAWRRSDWYAHEVFTKTSELTKQIFPITLDIEHPRWQPGLERLQKANAILPRQRGADGRMFKRKLGARRVRRRPSSVALHDPAKHEVPASTRLEPAY
jgi:magnesium-protoporphyrin IX monomethyl ester (oxidative) cyclase